MLPPHPEPVQIQIQRGPRSAQGRMVRTDLSRGVVTVVFDSSSDLRLPLATRVRTLVRIPHRRQPLRLTSWVLSWSCDDRSVTYALVFPAEDVALLSPLANERESLRVRPADDDPKRVELCSRKDGASIFGELDDLSESGLGVRLDRAAEEWILGEGLEFPVRFRLPEGPPLTIQARVRQRRMQDEQVRYGVAFVPDEGFEEQRRRIYRYMTRRQVQAREADEAERRSA